MSIAKATAPLWALLADFAAVIAAHPIGPSDSIEAVRANTRKVRAQLERIEKVAEEQVS